MSDDDFGPQEGARRRGGRAMTGRVHNTRDGVLGVIRACPGVSTGTIQELLCLPDYPKPGTPRLTEDGSGAQFVERMKAERLITGNHADGWTITTRGVKRLDQRLAHQATPEHQAYLRGRHAGRYHVEEAA